MLGIWAGTYKAENGIKLLSSWVVFVLDFKTKEG
jgi:hypothetical protein